ncbi:MMPL family transporter [Mycobacterium lepromatosis]|uniref:Transmembrane transport protein MmpL7 n=1 Tax=Mycobacterium lepromatosis TaxID=480418 RepID=A0A0F4ETA4_9MYCO|nr:MMPL family transporter [Mycobacterium lepromatosis]KJX75852.1 transmembrane transport protein MmpL7 [Mycobacterium lepromatosis]UKN41520.1 membrane protein [Mycobacterium lepromatosis]
MSADDSHRSPRLANLLVITAWVTAVVIANLIFTLTQAKPRDNNSALLPQDTMTITTTNQIAQAFPGAGTNAIAYLVVEGSRTLEPEDQPYYDAAVSALRADTRDVGSVLDWWSDPLTAPLGTSPDSRSAIALIWLQGEAGTAQARESLGAIRSVVRQLPPSEKLHARIVVPATTNDMPMAMTAWQGMAIVTAAAVIAILFLLRARQSIRIVGIMLLTADFSLAAAWPLAAVVLGQAGGTVSGFSWTLAAVLTIGTITASTLLASRSDAGDSAVPTYRNRLPALALLGGCVALLTGTLLLARTPALRSISTVALSVSVALAASLMLLPTLIKLARPNGQVSPQVNDTTWIRRLLVPKFSSPARVTAVVLATCALPVIGMRLSLAEDHTGQSGAQVLPGNLLPDILLIKSARDLRDPAALIAIDQVSHRLMEIPGVRKVESAAWPAGVPWTDASLSSAAGRLADQLGQQAGSFVPAVTAIKQMKTMIDQMSDAVDQLESTVNVALAGAHQVQQYLNPVLSAARNIKSKTAEFSGYLETVRGWVVSVTNCPNDVLCSAMHKVIEPYDKVATSIDQLSNGVDRISAISDRTMSSLNEVPHMVAQMRAALKQVRSFIPRLESTIQELMPQIAQASAMLKNLSEDFVDTGEGGFHLSMKELRSSAYQHVRESMFSSDGTATRLFVYTNAHNPGLDTAARAHQLEIAAGKAMKYGSLVDSRITLGGAVQVAVATRAALTHDVVLLTAMLLALVVLVSMWSSAGSGVAVGLGVLAAYLSGLGISVALWQHVLDRELQASVPLVSFAVLVSCGVPYLVAGLKAVRVSAETETKTAATVSVRRAVVPLTVLGAIFGTGLVVAAGASLSALSQVGTVLVIGLGALTAVEQVSNSRYHGRQSGHGSVVETAGPIKW